MRLKLLVVLFLLLIQSGYAEKYTEYTRENGSTGNFDDKTEYMLLDAFATWCVPCQLSMPHLNEIYDTVEGEVDIVSISFDTLETLDEIIQFKADFNGRWEFGWDHDGKLNETFQVHYYPTTMLLDGQRNVVKQWIGITNTKSVLLEIDKYVEIKGRFLRDPQGYLSDNPLWYVVIIGLPAILIVLIPRYFQKK